MGAGLPDTFGRQVEEVRAIFGELEIIEATADYLVYVTADEHEHGKRGDPNNCMFSQACKRALGSKGVLFYPTVAYVDVIDPKDPTRRVVMRFTLPVSTRKALEDFDAEVDGFIERTFLLKAVSPGRRLANQAKQKRKEYRQQKREKQARTPEQEQAVKASHEKRVKTLRSKQLMGVRSGSGKVHTTAA